MGINVTVTGKFLNLSGNSDVNFEKMHKSLNNMFDGTNIDISKINFGTEEQPLFFENANVNFNFDFSVAETLGDISESDHLIIAAPFAKNKIATGVTSQEGGKVVYVDGGLFSGVSNNIFSRATQVTAHEVLSHSFNIGHSKNPFKLAYGGGADAISWYVSKSDISNAVSNAASGKVNKGRVLQSGIYGKIPNQTIIGTDGTKYHISKAGVNISKLNVNLAKKHRRK